MTGPLIALGAAVLFGTGLVLLLLHIKATAKPSFLVQGLRVYAGRHVEWLATHRSEMDAAVAEALAWWCASYPAEAWAITRYVDQSSLRTVGDVLGARGRTLGRGIQMWTPTDMERAKYTAGFPGEGWFPVWLRVLQHEVSHLALGALGHDTTDAAGQHTRMRRENCPFA